MKAFKSLSLLLILIVAPFLFLGCENNNKTATIKPNYERIFEDFVEVCSIKFGTTTLNSYAKIIYSEPIEIDETAFYNSNHQYSLYPQRPPEDIILTSKKTLSQSFIIGESVAYVQHHDIDNNMDSIFELTQKTIIAIEYNIYSVKVLTDGMFAIKLNNGDTITYTRTDTFEISYFS